MLRKTQASGCKACEVSILVWSGPEELKGLENKSRVAGKQNKREVWLTRGVPKMWGEPGALKHGPESPVTPHLRNHVHRHASSAFAYLRDRWPTKVSLVIF